MAIRLKVNPEPRWVDISSGAALHLAPPTSYLVAVARARADALFTDLLQSGEAVTRVGGRIEGTPDLGTPEAAKGVHEGLFALSLAELAADGWKNVNDDDGVPVPFNIALLPQLFASPGVPDAFVRHYLHPLDQVEMEGNA
jgi:hypothetical protein